MTKSLRPYNPEKLGIPVESLRRERVRLRRMISRYQKLRGLGYPPETCLYDAFQKENRSSHGVSAGMGADAFNALLSRRLDDAQEMVDKVRDAVLSPMFSALVATIDEAENDTNPVSVMEALCKTPSLRDQKQIRIWAELERNMLVALQLLKMELIAPQEQVSTNLREVKRRANEELFEEELRRLHIVMELDPGNAYRVQSETCRIFLDLDQFHLHVRELTEEKRTFFAEEGYLCRVLIGDTQRYLVRSESRRKRRMSKFIKINRGRELSDVLGWKWVLVGTMPLQGGAIRPATMEDVRKFTVFTRRVFWNANGPLEERMDRSPPNKDSSGNYHAEKIVGVFHHEINGRPWIMRAEQITTTLEIAVNEQYSRGDENHVLYAGRRALVHVVPELFGHIPGFLDELKTRRGELELEWLRRLPRVYEPGRARMTIDPDAAYDRLEDLLGQVEEGEGDSAFQEAVFVFLRAPKFRERFKPLFEAALRDAARAA